MKTKAQLIFACILALWCCKSAQVSSVHTSVDSLPPLERVLNAYIEASGGREALRSVSDRQCTGSLTWQFPDQDPSEVIIPAQVFASGPERWRLLLETSQGPLAMGNDGREGWVQNSDRIYVDEKQRKSKLAFLFSARGPLHLAEYFPDLKLVSKDNIEQRTVFRVEYHTDGGQTDTMCFDARSGLLVQIGEDLKLGDYREVQGVTLPFRIEVVRGKNTATYTFDRIEHNVSLSQEETSRPTPDQVFPDAFEGLTETRVLPLLLDFPSGHEDMNVPCRDGRYLYDLIRSRNYKRGLEIGAFTGYSALWFGLAFQETGGQLITIEIDPEPGEEARRNIRKAGLEAVIDVRIVDAFAEIPKIPGDFDFVFIDAWKPDYMRFLELLRERVAPGGALVAHNVTNHARDMQDFLKVIREDPGLETTLHEISAEGMSISFVRDPDAQWAAASLSEARSRLEHPGFTTVIAPPAVTPYDSESRISSPVYPVLLEEEPQMPSPIRTADGQEYVKAVTKEGKFILAPVTIENGAPYVYAQHGKGKQLAVDAADFPALASTQARNWIIC